jgi:hypothetical protein
MPSSSKTQLDAASKRADKLRAKGQELDSKEYLSLEPNGRVTNIRNTTPIEREFPHLVEVAVPENGFSRSSEPRAERFF